MNTLLLNYVSLFFIFVIVVYLPFLYLWIWYKNRIGRKFARENNAIKFYIKHTKINDLLTVFSINGKKPVVHRNLKQYGFYLLPGENTLEIQYQWFKWNFFRALMPETNPMATHTEKMEKLTVTAEKDKIYELYFDHNIKRYVFTAVKTIK